MVEGKKSLYIITGTTRGIGAALVASALAKSENRVVSLSRRDSRMRDRHQHIRIDLNDIHEIGAVFRRIRLDRQDARELALTVLINNAGVLDPIAPIPDCDDSLLAQNIRVNLTAPLVLSRHFFHFASGFPGRKWIINITSGAGRAPYSGWSAYCAAKAGLDMATRTMALEFSRIDPRFSVCAVAPGTVDTAMQDKIRGCRRRQFDQVEKFVRLKSDGGLAPPRWVAETLFRRLAQGRFENGGRYDLRET